MRSTRRSQDTNLQETLTTHLTETAHVNVLLVFGTLKRELERQRRCCQATGSPLATPRRLSINYSCLDAEQAGSFARDKT